MSVDRPEGAVRPDGMNRPDGSLRLDVALLAAGLARSRTHARRIIEEGRARLAGRIVSKASTPVPPGAELAVIDVPDGVEFASRAAHKLIGALDGLGIDPTGRRCLDAGASTGGFTDVLLRRGAACVLAVDIGHDQLAEHVRSDPRVIVRDGTSVRDLTAELLGGSVDLVVADLSFISLRTVIAALGAVLPPGCRLCRASPSRPRWRASHSAPSGPAPCRGRTAIASTSCICARAARPSHWTPRPVT